MPLDLPTIVTGSRPPCQTFLFYRLYKCSQVRFISINGLKCTICLIPKLILFFASPQIPVDKDEMTNWLYQIFQEKDEMLEKFYATGVFPKNEFSQSPAPNRFVVQDNLRFFILHLFFITSTYVHYQMLSTVFRYMWYVCSFSFNFMEIFIARLKVSILILLLDIVNNSIQFN